MTDIIITLPASYKWEQYQRELDAAEQGELLNFKVRYLPKCSVGDKCYIVHQGFIRGYMHIVELGRKDFKCTTTGQRWSGNFISRSGKFFPISPIPMRGFQGFKYMK